MSPDAPRDARENGLERDIDPLAEHAETDQSDVDRRIREETEELIRHEWEHGPGKDDRDPLGAAHI